VKRHHEGVIPFPGTTQGFYLAIKPPFTDNRDIFCKYFLLKKFSIIIAGN